jgi:hypothetical protein
VEHFVVQVNKTTFDVFEGKQWGHGVEPNSSWSRLRSGRNGVYVAKGRSLPYALVRALAGAINPTLPTQHVSV